MNGNRRLRVLAALIALVAPLAPDAAAQAPAGVTRGLDVSHHSGSVDWKAVREEGYHFVYVKATEGVDGGDPKFQQYWQNLGDMGVPRGAYHFFVTEDDPEEQAEFFLSRVTFEPGDLPPAVDVELIGAGTTGDLVASLRRFLERVEQAAGVTPIIYTNAGFWDQHLDSSFGRYPLWIAEYGVAEPALPEGWEEWLLWQYRGDVDIEGIEKGADLSRLNAGRDLHALRIPYAPGSQGPQQE